VTRNEDCEAFIEIVNGVPMFSLARGDQKAGTMRVEDSVPWASFVNFEESSHRQWFRSRAAVDMLPDWGVIILQSSVGKVIRVAESVHEQAQLTELLVLLQRVFVEDRPRVLARIEAAAKMSNVETDTPLGVLPIEAAKAFPTRDVTPKRSF
jgi:hypothetical protein